jgi:hypothetical protein
MERVGVKEGNGYKQGKNGHFSARRRDHGAVMGIWGYRRFLLSFLLLERVGREACFSVCSRRALPMLIPSLVEIQLSFLVIKRSVW